MCIRNRHVKFMALAIIHVFNANKKYQSKPYILRATQNKADI